MRTALPLLVVLAFACSPCRAQTSEPGKPGAAQPAAGAKTDDALSPSTLPKERQNVKEQPGTAARINALSPDEERRLERSRARAHDAAKVAPLPAAETHAASPAPATRTDAKTETKTETKAEPAPARTAAAPAARAKRDAAPVRRQAERALRHERSAGRSVRPDRDTADLGRSRPAGRADRRERAPRVGDVVPPGVALYPLPPAYGAPQAAMRAPLPFPRARDDEPDDDDGPPPRRFMTPF